MQSNTNNDTRSKQQLLQQGLNPPIITSNCLHEDIQESSFNVELGTDSSKIFVFIYGQENSIHKGGIYKAEFTFTKDYLRVRPEGKFFSPLPYHFNIGSDGGICLNYYNNWDMTKTFVILVENLCYLIHDQNPDSCLRGIIGEEEKNKYNLFVQNVKNQALVYQQSFQSG
ncbi:hypothetical protein ABPG72_002725 [Tetrahymena utriculariae]